jgi:hypothetical protein
MKSGDASYFYLAIQLDVLGRCEHATQQEQQPYTFNEYSLVEKPLGSRLGRYPH